MNKLSLLLVCITAVFSTNCSNSKKMASPTEEIFFAKKWTLVELWDHSVSSEAKVPFLLFTKANNHVSGNTGCNSLSGTFDMVTDSISFSPLMTTKMACLDNDNNEGSFLNALSQINHWRIENDQLLLLNGSTKLAVFKTVDMPATVNAAVDTTRLNGNWELTYISGKRIAFNGLYPEKKPMIHFDFGKNEVGGHTSCNGFGGNFTMEGDKVQFSQLIHTMIACEGEGEKTFLEMLEKVNRYSASADNVLTMMIDDVAVMRFAKK